jgi:hypothetical protein
MGNINDWITADKISGSAGETTVTLTCDANNTASSRSYTLDVELDGSGEVAHCTINQGKAFASTYWIVQYVYISTSKTVLEIREDSIDGILRYKGTIDINKNVSWECDGVTTSSDTSVLKNLMEEIYAAWSASNYGDTLSAAVIYRYTEGSADINSYMQEVIKYPILYPQAVSSAYGSGSYRLLNAGNISDTNTAKQFVYVLNMDYSSETSVYNLGLNYNSFCTIENTNNQPTTNKYSLLSYLPFIRLNYISLNKANLFGTGGLDATISGKKVSFFPYNMYALSTDLRNGNTKSFNHYEYNDTNDYVTGHTKTFNADTNKLSIQQITNYAYDSNNNAVLNINPFTTSIYTTIKTLAVNIEGYEQIFNSNKVFVPTDLSVSKTNKSTANVTIKVYNDVDDRTYEQSVGINTPAHPMFSLRHGEITATVNTSTNAVTSMTLRYVSDNE